MRYTQQDATKKAREWVKTHPAWILICDMKADPDIFYFQFHELTDKERSYWGSAGHYNEYAIRRCKVQRAHITGDGEIYASICDIPPNKGGSMMMFKVGVKSGLRNLAMRAPEYA